MSRPKDWVILSDLSCSLVAMQYGGKLLWVDSSFKFAKTEKASCCSISAAFFAAEHFTWHHALASLHVFRYSLDILEADRGWFPYSPSPNIPCLPTHNIAKLLNTTGTYISRGGGSSLPENLEERREPLKPYGVLFQLEKDTPSSALCKT